MSMILAFPDRMRVGKYIWFGNSPFTFEAVHGFVVQGEWTLSECPELLRAVLMAACARVPLEHYRGNFPADHPWITDLAEGAFALALAPAFYRLQDGAPVRIADALDGLDFDLKTHREMLSVLIEGAI